MKTMRSMARTILLVASLALFAACGPTPAPAATPAPTPGVVVTRINENEAVYNEIVQTKTFDQCDSASMFRAQIHFGESSGQTSQKELVLGASVTGGADLSGLAKVELQGSIEQHFATSESTISSHEENVSIEVPAHTRQFYTIVWREKRHEGTVEYAENGEAKVADYSYRVGLELESSTARDIPCPLPSRTPLTPVTPIPEATPTTPPPRPIAQGCISAQNWQPVSSDIQALENSLVNPDGCTSLEALGMYADKDGVLHINLKGQRSTVTSGIYTPLDNNAVIEFKVYVNSMYLVYRETPVTVTFAVAAAARPMEPRNSARFKLFVESIESAPLVHFVLADQEESVGVKVGTQHYEYGRTYTIRLAMQGNSMKVFINNLEMKESLFIPTGQKVFYIGYYLPLLAGADVEIKDIRINNHFR